ncbi:MAG: amino acid/amide ABC transporter substrate-binding protein HAAT family [bacterium]|nr:MAG: amino acid/amide ABC transporter substrate-binding protein HAAT family [bacterium]
MKTKIFFMIGFVLSLTVLLSSGKFTYAKEARGVTDDTIKLGVIVDLTGPIAVNTIPYLEAARNYFRYINEEGGINGRKVKLIVEDDRYSIPMAIAAFKKLLYKDEVIALLGPAGTSQTVALSAQIDKLKVPTMTLSISRVWKEKKYIFIIALPYEDGLRTTIDYIANDLKGKGSRIGFTTFDNDYGRNGLAAAREQAKLYDIKIHNEVLNPGALDATTQVLNLKKYNLKHVIAHQEIGTATALLRDAKKYGFDATFLGGYAASFEEVVKLAGKAAKNFIGIHYINSWYDESRGMTSLREIAERYQPGKGFRNKFYTEGWVSAMIYTEAMKRAGKGLNYDTMVDCLEGFRDFDTKGLCPPITFKKGDHIGGKQCRFFRADVDKGLLVPLTGWKEPKDKD